MEKNHNSTLDKSSQHHKFVRSHIQDDFSTLTPSSPVSAAEITKRLHRMTISNSQDILKASHESFFTHNNAHTIPKLSSAMLLKRYRSIRSTFAALGAEPKNFTGLKHLQAEVNLILNLNSFKEIPSPSIASNNKDAFTPLTPTLRSDIPFSFNSSNSAHNVKKDIRRKIIYRLSQYDKKITKLLYSLENSPENPLIILFQEMMRIHRQLQSAVEAVSLVDLRRDFSSLEVQIKI